MGQIYIQDVGYVRPTNEGTQAASGNRANSGTVITLKTAEFIPNLSRNISGQPELASNSPSEVNLGSLKNMQFTLRVVLNINTDTDTAKMQHLLDLISTNGYKLMWYQYSSAANEKNNGQLIYRIAQNSKYGHQTTNAEKTAFTISDNFYHLHVHIYDIQPRHVGSSGMITLSLKGIVLPVETSILV